MSKLIEEGLGHLAVPGVMNTDKQNCFHAIFGVLASDLLARWAMSTISSGESLHS